MILRKTQLLRRAEHSVRLDTAHFGLRDFDAGKPRTHQRNRHLHAGDHVRCAADDREWRAAANINLAQG